MQLSTASTPIYGNSLPVWAAAASLTVVVFGVLLLLRPLLVTRLGMLAGRKHRDLEEAVVLLLRRTRLFFVAVIALYAGAGLLTLPPRVEALLAAVVTFGVVLQLGLWGNAVVGLLVERHAQRRTGGEAGAATTVQALAFVVRFCLWVLLLLVALDHVGINVTALVAGLGVGGIAVALAVQNILGDLFASLSIMLDRPFVIGDFIIVDQLAGSVEHIGLKTTRIRSLSGEQIVFSNADLLKSRIRNYKRMYERRVAFSLGVVYDTSPDIVAAIPGIIRQIIESQPRVRFDRAHFTGFANSSLEFEAVYYVLDPDTTLYMDVQQAINLAILRRFAADGIEFAFPTQTMHVRPTPPPNLERNGSPGAPVTRVISAS